MEIYACIDRTFDYCIASGRFNVNDIRKWAIHNEWTLRVKNFNFCNRCVYQMSIYVDLLCCIFRSSNNNNNSNGKKEKKSNWKLPQNIALAIMALHLKWLWLKRISTYARFQLPKLLMVGIVGRNGMRLPHINCVLCTTIR